MLGKSAGTKRWIRYVTPFLMVAMLVVSGCSSSKKAAYPEKPVEMSVLFGAGTSADLIARRLGDGMAKEMKVAVPVVNRTGGGGAVGYTYVKGQKADGYSIVWNSNSVSTAHYSGNMPFDYTAFEPVARVSIETVALAVKADAPWKTLKDFAAYAKQNPGKVKIGNSGLGSFTHIVAAAMANEAGIQVIHVPFGSGQEVANLLGGKVDAVMQLPAGLSSQVAAGTLRLLGVSSESRDPSFPDTPTLKEQGVNLVMDMWRGLAVPKGTPPDVIKALDTAAKKVAESKEFAADGTKLGYKAAYLSASQFGKLIADDDKRISQLMTDLGLNKK